MAQFLIPRKPIDILRFHLDSYRNALTATENEIGVLENQISDSKVERAELIVAIDGLEQMIGKLNG
jgi:hypothetical protein